MVNMQLTEEEQRLIRHQITCSCAKCQGGRIIAGRERVWVDGFEEPPRPSIITRLLRWLLSLLLMALFGRKKLTCHYCNKRTRIVYDGLIRQWECFNCGETNYLDEHGEIEDAPAATSGQASGQSDSFYMDPWKHSHKKLKESDAFCPACLDNQRKLTSALGELDLELDEYHPDYYDSQRRYDKSKRELQKLYPIVCEHCVAGTKERILKTQYLAKADNMGKVLARARDRSEQARKSQLVKLWDLMRSLVETETYARVSNLSFEDWCILLGRCSWYFGVTSQALLHIAALNVFIQHWLPILAEEQYGTLLSTTSNPRLPTILLNLVSAVTKALLLINGSRTWGFCSLLLSGVSIWWNPYMNEVLRGFDRHLFGFKRWYSWTAVLLGLRTSFYYVGMDLEALADPLSPATAAAHGFMLLATVMIVQQLILPSITKNLAPLWEPRYMPDNKPFEGSVGSDNTNIADALNEIARTPAAPRKSSPSSPDLTPDEFHQGNRSSNSTGGQSSFRRPLASSDLGPNTLHQSRNSGGAFATGNQSASFGRSLGPTVPVYSQPGSTPHQRTGTATKLNLFPHKRNSVEQDGMDWSPDTSTPVPSIHRAFNPTLRNRQTTALKESFNSSPADSSPSNFWYKVPAAPLTPMQRALRAGQPKFRAIPQEVKENFFQTMTQKKSHLPKSPPKSDENDGPREYEMAHPKFFPPPQDDERDSLADVLEGWTLDDNEDTEWPETKSWRLCRFIQFLCLLISVVLWNFGPLLSLGDMALAAMVICSSIGFVVVPQHWSYDRRPRRARGVDVLCAGLGVLEMLVGIWCISTCFSGLHRISGGYSQFVSDISGYASCQRRGNLLLLFMIVQEFGAASIW